MHILAGAHSETVCRGHDRVGGREPPTAKGTAPSDGSRSS